MNNHLIDALDNLDACVFTGETLVIDEQRALLKEFVERWARAIVEYEAVPRCACCGTTENLHRDVGSGGPYRCNSPDCVVF